MPPRQTQGLDSGSTNFLQFASLDVKDKSLASSLQLLSDHGMGANPCKILFDTLLDANYPKTVRNGYWYSVGYAYSAFAPKTILSTSAQ